MYGGPARSLDDYPENEAAFVYEDGESDDFDLQPVQFAAYDQQYVKTSTGRFHGRRTLADLPGGVSIYREIVNCGVHERVGCRENVIGLGVSMGPPGSVVNGIELDPKDLVITRPGSELDLDVSVEGGAFLVLAVERSALESLACREAGCGFLDPERREPSVVRNAHVTGALGTACTALLRVCGRAPDAPLPPGTATALAAAMVAALELQTDLGAARERRSRKQSFATFARAREALAVMEEFDYAALAGATGRCPRSIQMAFAAHGGTTPLRYFRALKLHRVREVLRADQGDHPATIGDVAAAHGFWSWSRFTRLYRQQFGERPSETRARAQSRPRVVGAA